MHCRCMEEQRVAKLLKTSQGSGKRLQEFLIVKILVRKNWHTSDFPIVRQITSEESLSSVVII